MQSPVNKAGQGQNTTSKGNRVQLDNKEYNGRIEVFSLAEGLTIHPLNVSGTDWCPTWSPFCIFCQSLSSPCVRLLVGASVNPLDTLLYSLSSNRPLSLLEDDFAPGQAMLVTGLSTFISPATTYWVPIGFMNCTIQPSFTFYRPEYISTYYTLIF